MTEPLIPQFSCSLYLEEFVVPHIGTKKQKRLWQHNVAVPLIERQSPNFPA